MVLRNRVSETTATGTGNSYGIYRSTGSSVLIQDNQFVNASATGDYAIYSDYAAACLAVNNTLINFTTFLFLCTDSGNVTHTP